MTRNPERRGAGAHYSFMQMLLPRLSVALLSIATITAIGWACCKPPPPAALPVCTDPDVDRFCDNGVCGPNSPTVNGFPINGVRPNGQCNTDGVQLIPGSLIGGQGNLCTGASLDLDTDHLVGLNADGAIQCKGEQLKGASFEVRSWVDQDKSHKKSQRIVIQDVALYKPEQGEARTGYRLVADKPGALESLCTSRASVDFRESLGLRPVAPLDPSPVVKQDVIIPVSSELYDVFGQPIEAKDSPPPGRPWLHFACVHDALAKRSLYGLHTDSVERDRAALKMLTANYCGGKPFTVRGVKVEWNSGEQKDIEARWTSQGATCLTKLRVLYRNEPDPKEIPSDLPPQLTKICGDKGHDACHDLAAWKAAAHVCHIGSQTRRLALCASGVHDNEPFATYVTPNSGPP